MVDSGKARGPCGTCSCCGGSGVLRTENAGYRTCLECVGQGVKPRFQTLFRLPLAEVVDLSASTSGARRRTLP
jgi:hypothetical protein